MAAIFPCPKRSECSEDSVANLPSRNFTSEFPDRNLEFGIFHAPAGFPGFGSSGQPAPPSFCSGDTQEGADLCAITPPNKGLGGDLPTVYASTEQICTIACPNGSTASFTAPASLFLALTQQTANDLAFEFACDAVGLLCGTTLITNTLQTCVITCADSSTQSYSVAAGSFSGLSQAEADGAAMALACLVAQSKCLSGGTAPPIFPNAPQTCTVACSTGSFTFTVPAGIAHALSQAEADAQAQALACAAASLSCVNLPPLLSNTAQTCSQDCNGSNVSYTVPSGVFQANDQATANMIAFTFACAALSQSCTTGTVTTIPTPTAPNTQQSCTVACVGGGSFTYVVPYNSYRADNQAAANAVANTAACNLASTFRTCVASINGSTCDGDFFAEALAITGPFANNVTGTSIASGIMPPGIILSGTNIIGVASTGGTYTFSIRVNFSGGHFAIQPMTITVGAITGTLGAGEVNTAYSQSLGSTGFAAPVFSITAGALPPGLAMDANGNITGTPTSQGTFNFIVQVSG